MKDMKQEDGYHYVNRGFHDYNKYLVEPVLRALATAPKGRPNRVFDLGCGNGSWANLLHEKGYDVVGVDPSVNGIAIAKERYPNLKLEAGSAYDDLVCQFGQFPACISVEVVEHLYAPRTYAANLYALLEPGGIAVVTTPYHGYWKNLLVGVLGRWDVHFSPMWDHGHIKFWSEKTLGELLREAGFKSIHFQRPGRIFPCFARSMVAVAVK